ncbi:MAG TPA: selenocysteine-specific translation elongation factor [Candidatus Obscuribacterales bacterium]
MVTAELSKQPAYFTVSTAGHVDHGKTSLLRALTGIDPDRLKEEKQRQMTTDLGFAHLRLSTRQVQDAGSRLNREMVIGFVDVPGHGKFLKNMLAGVGGLDMALLVVAADEGPMPQTIQHAKILSILGIKRILLVVTKTDLAGESRQEEVINKSRVMLDRFGLTLVDIVRVSNTNKSGFDELTKSLVRALSSNAARTEDVTAAPAFLPIDRVFSKAGYGVVVTGTLVKGSIQQGDNLYIEPGGLKARVRGLETFNRTIEKATAGQRLALNLALKENKPLARGQAILAQIVAPTNVLIVELMQAGGEFDENFEESVINQTGRLYHGTTECNCSVRWLERLPQMEGAYVTYAAQISLIDPVVADPGDRFVLRFGDEGLAGGRIMLNARTRWLTRARLNEMCKLLAKEQYDSATCFFLDSNPQKLAKESALNCFLPPFMRASVLQSLKSEGRITQLGDFLLTSESKQYLMQRLIQEVETANKGDVVSEGKNSLEAIRNKLITGLDRGSFQQLVKEAVEKGIIVRQAERLLPASGSQKETNAELESIAGQIEEILLSNLCLEIEELSKQVRADKKKVTAALQYLAGKGKATIVGYEFACSARTLSQAHSTLSRLWQQKRDIAPGDFREAMGTTRKYAMAMLAYFDDQAITRRLPSGRVLLKAPKE